MLYYNIEDYILEINKYIIDNNIINYKIFLATDILENLNIFKKKFGDNLVINEDNIFMSKDKDDLEPHIGFSIYDVDLGTFNSKKMGTIGAKEIITDALVLSKCDIFFNSISAMSHWVSIFNPDLPIFNIQSKKININNNLYKEMDDLYK